MTKSANWRLFDTVKFICDDNLGKLAAYLRILGIDTAFDENIDDPALLRKAAAEHRILLTRDHKMKNRSHPFGHLVLEMDGPLEQLSFVVKQLSVTINTDAIFSRCPKCNVLCETADKRSLEASLFPYILKTHDIIKRCPSCGRFYWKGSHYKAILRKLKNALGDDRLSGKWPDASHQT